MSKLVLVRRLFLQGLWGKVYDRKIVCLIRLPRSKKKSSNTYISRSGVEQNSRSMNVVVVVLLANLGVPAAGVPRRTLTISSYWCSLLFFPTPACFLSPVLLLSSQPSWDSEPINHRSHPRTRFLQFVRRHHTCDFQPTFTQSQWHLLRKRPSRV